MPDKNAPKLNLLREKMAQKNINAYLISSADAHQSEYAPPYWRTREWLSGFTGSLGWVAVTSNASGLWTDGRYFIQAEAQIKDTGMVLYKMGEAGVLTYPEWLARHLPDGSTLAFDGRTFSIAEYKKIREALSEKEIHFECNHDLIGEIWDERPAFPAGKAFPHEIRFTGLTAAEKLKKVRNGMEASSWYLTTALDNIAWLLNIRGSDIPQTPVVYAYMLIGKESAFVFIKPDKLDKNIKDDLMQQGFTLHPYDAVFDFLRDIKGSLCYDPAQINVKLAEAVPKSCAAKEIEDIIVHLKAVKNEVELKNIRHAFIKEGIVWVRLLQFLEEWVAGSDRPLYEADMAKLLNQYRQSQADYLEPSFDTIAAYNANAASMHYSPLGKGAEIKREGLLLIDTGAQYLDGTTDITRTVAMGTITDEMRTDYTLALKGHIALASAVFLYGTTGLQLDAIARMPLWAAGKNYRSGTGHGLGYCLGVHEGPHSISTRPVTAALEAGMLVTNEPGVYIEGRYGIRIENVLLVKELYANEDGVFMGFETISFCPLDLRLVEVGLLTEPEKKWLNAYHKQVYGALSPYISEKEKMWLQAVTRPVVIT